MDETIKICKHNINGTGYCDILGGYCVEGPCSHEELAEYAPVRHGHWVSLADCSNAGVYCSNCHKKVYKEDYALCNRKNKLRSNYCPKCGADMRESKED